MPDTNFFWDPLSDNILQERDENGAVTAEYSTEPGLYGNMICQNRGGVESQYHFDAQGSTLALTDDNRQVTDTNAYTAFGEVTEYTGSTVNPFLYVGQRGYYQLLSGQTVIRRRTYSPIWNRWLSADPVDRAQLQKYGYCRNAPAVGIDPSGLLTIKPVCEDEINYVHGIECGKTARGRWIFELDRDAPCPGYIVQMIIAYCKVSQCAGCPITGPNSPSLVYWEAWEVDPTKDKRHELAHRQFGYTDKCTITARNAHCGSVMIVGDVKFFCKDPSHPAARGVGTGELKALWPIGQEYTTSYNCEFSALDLPSVRFGDPAAPTWFDKPAIEAMDRRSCKLDWDCCQCRSEQYHVHSTFHPDPHDASCVKV